MKVKWSPVLTSPVGEVPEGSLAGLLERVSRHLNEAMTARALEAVRHSVRSAILNFLDSRGVFVIRGVFEVQVDSFRIMAGLPLSKRESDYRFFLMVLGLPVPGAAAEALAKKRRARGEVSIKVAFDKRWYATLPEAVRRELEAVLG